MQLRPSSILVAGLAALLLACESAAELTGENDAGGGTMTPGGTGGAPGGSGPVAAGGSGGDPGTGGELEEEVEGDRGQIIVFSADGDPPMAAAKFAFDVKTLLAPSVAW